jgi:hypothetical protein
MHDINEIVIYCNNHVCSDKYSAKVRNIYHAQFDQIGPDIMINTTMNAHAAP